MPTNLDPFHLQRTFLNTPKPRPKIRWSGPCTAPNASQHRRNAGCFLLSNLSSYVTSSDTAGGVVFQGDGLGTVSAYNTDNGERLWEFESYGALKAFDPSAGKTVEPAKLRFVGKLSRQIRVEQDPPKPPNGHASPQELADVWWEMRPPV